MWAFIAQLIVSYILAVVFAPKPQNAKPAGFEDIKFPEAREGKEIPVLFGCRKIQGYNTIWSGDFRSVAIKSKGGKK